MSIHNINDAMIDRDFYWLFDSVANMIDLLVEPLGTGNISLPAIPKRTGKFIAPYAFAGQLRLLYEYACDRQQLSRSYILETFQTLERLLTLNVATTLLTKDDDDDDEPAPTAASAPSILEKFFDHPVVRIVYAAMGRLSINENRPLTLNELTALTGFDDERARGVGIKTTTDADGNTFYTPSSVAAIIRNNSLSDLSE